MNVKISKAAKAVVAGVFACLIAGVTVAQPLIADDSVSLSDWITIGLAILGAAGVYRVPNATDDDPKGSV